MKICYIDTEFRSEALGIIDHANAIIREYLQAGFRLTLRQLFYQFVSRDLIPNQTKEYKRLGSIINNARLAGLIDWDAIEDRGRNLLSSAAWKNPQSIIKSCAAAYQTDPWLVQGYYVECWIEKEALIGVVSPTCTEYRVPHFACKGYTSQSEMWSAGHLRLRNKIKDGKKIVIIHLGDHDPSGIDMTRDIQERLMMFAQGHVKVVRLALNMNQVEEFNPPPNPAKLTDSRFGGYAAKYGDESWELDALSPTTIAGLIEDEINQRIDSELWNDSMDQERAECLVLERISRNYQAVTDWLDEEGR